MLASRCICGLLAPPTRRSFGTTAARRARNQRASPSGSQPGAVTSASSDGTVSHRVTGLYALPLPGHKPGDPLPSIEDDPRLQRQRRPRALRWRDLGEGEHPPGVFSSGRIPTNLPTSDSTDAQRIYLPNIRMILVRNAPAPAGSAMADQDPFIATFRCSPKLTKPDIVQYLRQCYGLGIRSITTTIYHGEQMRQRNGGYRRSHPSYKKVVVGLEQPFRYPPAPTVDQLEYSYQLRDTGRNNARRKAIFGDLSTNGWAKRSSRQRTEADGPPTRLPQLKQALALRRDMAERSVRKRMGVLEGERR